MDPKRQQRASERNNLMRLAAQVAENEAKGYYINEKKAIKIIGDKGIVIPLSDGTSSLFFEDRESAEQVHKSLSTFRNDSFAPTYIKLIDHPDGENKPLFEIRITSAFAHGLSKEPDVPARRINSVPVDKAHKLSAAQKCFAALSGLETNSYELPNSTELSPIKSPNDVESVYSQTLKIISSHGIVMAVEKNNPSLFFSDQESRDKAYELISSMGVNSNVLKKENFTTRERSVYEIKIPKELFEKLSKERDLYYRGADGAVPVSNDERVRMSLRSFRRLDRYAAEKTDKPAIIRDIAEHGVVAVIDGPFSSIFFKDKDFREKMYDRLLTIGKIATYPNPPYQLIQPNDHELNEDQYLYEIPIKRNFADELVRSHRFPKDRLIYEGAEVASNDKVSEALNLFAELEQNGIDPVTQIDDVHSNNALSDEEMLKIIFSDAHIALLRDGRVSIYLEDKNACWKIVDTLRSKHPNWLTENSFGKKWSVKHHTTIGDVFEITLSSEFGAVLLNHPDLKTHHLIADGYSVENADKIKELCVTLSKSHRLEVKPVIKHPLSITAPEPTEVLNPLPLPVAVIPFIGPAEVNPTHGVADIFVTNGLPKPDETIQPPSVEINPGSTVQTIASPPIKKEPPMILPEPIQPEVTQPNLTITEPYAGYSEYLASFGFQIKEHRENRKMSRDQVAEAATKKLEHGEKITADDIKYWEQSRGQLPTDMQFEALAKVLIDENVKVIDKIKGRKEFEASYIKSLEAKQSPSKANEGDLYLFADHLIDLRETMVLTTAATRDSFALLIEDKLKNSIPPEEEKLLRQHKGKFIAGIEAGVVKPSKNLMLALVKALDDQEPLKEQEKTALYEAYERLPGSNNKITRKNIVASNGRPAAHESNGTVTANPHAPYDGEPTSFVPTELTDSIRKRSKRMSTPEPEDPILKLKFKIRKIVNKDDDVMRVLSEAVGINGTTLASVLSANTDPFLTGGFSNNTRTKLANYIRQIYPDNADQKVAEFELLFSELKQACSEARDSAPSVG